MNLSKTPHNWVKCYCGGFMLSVYQCEKLKSPGSPHVYTYKKPRWQLVNCFPLKFKRKMERLYGKTNAKTSD